MKENGEEYGGDTCQCANAFYLTLQEFNFNYFVNVFSYMIFKSTAMLKYYETTIGYQMLFEGN
jgi:hypothetical protein